MYAVIAVSRLQFITKRWHSGIRNTYHRQPKRQLATHSQDHLRNDAAVSLENVAILNENPTNFVGNRSLNSVFGLTRPLTPNNEESLPWSGSTPPSRDMGLRNSNRNRFVAISFI